MKCSADNLLYLTFAVLWKLLWWQEFIFRDTLDIPRTYQAVQNFHADAEGGVETRCGKIYFRRQKEKRI